MTEAERIARAQAKRERRARRDAAWRLRVVQLGRRDALLHTLADVMSPHRHERAWSNSDAVRSHDEDSRAWLLRDAAERHADETLAWVIRCKRIARGLARASSRRPSAR